MNAQRVWQSQSIEAPRMSLAYVRHVTRDFERRRRRRAVLSYVLSFFACVLNAFVAWKFFFTKPLLVAATSYNLVFIPYAIYRLNRHVNAESSPADAGVLDTLRYQRRQLERQRDWGRGNWRWTMLAVLPNYFLVLASQYFENGPVPWKRVAIVALIFFGGLALSALSAELKARQSQREIDALDSLAGG